MIKIGQKNMMVQLMKHGLLLRVPLISLQIVYVDRLLLVIERIIGIHGQLESNLSSQLPRTGMRRER